MITRGSLFEVFVSHSSGQPEFRFSTRVTVLRQKKKKILGTSALNFFFSLYIYISASFSRNTMDFPCIFILVWGSLFFFPFNWQIAFSALYTVNLFLSYVVSSLYLTFIYSLIKIFSYLLKYEKYSKIVCQYEAIHIQIYLFF